MIEWFLVVLRSGSDMDRRPDLCESYQIKYYFTLPASLLYTPQFWYVINETMLFALFNNNTFIQL